MKDTIKSIVIYLSLFSLTIGTPYWLINYSPWGGVKTEVIGYETITLKKIDPPKHFYIDYVKDGKYYTYQHVSKHCNSYRKLKIDHEYKIPVVKKVWNSGERIELDFYEGLCN